MRYLLSNLPLNLGEEALDLAKPLAHALGGAVSDYRAVTLERRSLDARHKGAIRFLAALSFDSDLALTMGLLPGGLKLEPAPPAAPYAVARPPRKPRVVIVGSGPAGTFCALRLLDYGLEPMVLERGPAMGNRVKAISGLWQDGVLDPEANAQFGEGGAGTFSDGKLTTRIGHPATRYVLEAFVRFGANPRILYLAKPHVGTDVIRRCAVLIRRSAEARGAQYRFQARLEEVRFDGQGLPKYLRRSERSKLAGRFSPTSGRGATFWLLPRRPACCTAAARPAARACGWPAMSSAQALFAVACMLLTHPERLSAEDALMIDCGGDEYSVRGDYHLRPRAPLRLRHLRHRVQHLL